MGPPNSPSIPAPRLARRAHWRPAMQKRALLLLLALLIHSRPAWPCSPVHDNGSDVILPAEGAVVGQYPLLVDPWGSGLALRDSRGLEMAVEPFTGSDLTGVLGSISQPLGLFVPSAPLPAGAYRWGHPDDSGGVRFTVSEAPPEPAAPAFSDVRLRLVVRKPIESSGCGGASSCDGTTISFLDVEPAGARESDAFLVTLGGGDAPDRYLVSPGYGGGTITFHHRQSGSLAEQPTCVTVQALEADGSLGEPVDAGCVDPDDDGDPRVHNYDRRAGCAALGAQAPMWLVLAGLALARRRARG
jgi:hypothetical protein